MLPLWWITLYIKVGATFMSYALITNKIWFYPNWFTVEQFIEPMITMYVCEWQIKSQIRLVPRRSLLLYCLQYLQDCSQNCAKDLFAYLAVCCRRALRKVSGWNSSERSSTSRNKESELHFSTQDPRARALATRALNQWMGSSGPSKWLLQERGTYGQKKVLLRIAGLHLTSRRPCWWSRTKAFLSSGN